MTLPNKGWNFFTSGLEFIDCSSINEHDYLKCYPMIAQMLNYVFKYDINDFEDIIKDDFKVIEHPFNKEKKAIVQIKLKHTKNLSSISINFEFIKSIYYTDNSTYPTIYFRFEKCNISILNKLEKLPLELDRPIDIFSYFDNNGLYLYTDIHYLVHFNNFNNYSNSFNSFSICLTINPTSTDAKLYYTNELVYIDNYVGMFSSVDDIFNDCNKEYIYQLNVFYKIMRRMSHLKSYDPIVEIIPMINEESISSLDSFKYIFDNFLKTPENKARISLIEMILL